MQLVHLGACTRTQRMPFLPAVAPCVHMMCARAKAHTFAHIGSVIISFPFPVTHPPAYETTRSGCISAHVRAHGACPSCGCPLRPQDVRESTELSGIVEACAGIEDAVNRDAAAVGMFTGGTLPVPASNSRRDLYDLLDISLSLNIPSFR